MESIRQNIEFNTVRITDEAKEIREKAGTYAPWFIWFHLSAGELGSNSWTVEVTVFRWVSRWIPQKAEVELKDTEEKYKYISHEVDLLIYSIEPIVAYLGVGEFNEILCGAGRVYLLDQLEFTTCTIW